MKKFIPLTTILFLLLGQVAWAQLPPPCGVAGDEPPGCTLCGPVYAGTTGGYTPNITPPGFCGTIENNQWLSFVAGATSATVSITSFNCQNGQGVQLYMLDLNLNPVSNCFSSGGNNVPGNVTANGLTPGDLYLIMIDGFAGDICNIVIQVVGGVNQGPPDPPGPITPVPNVSPLCPGAVVCYSIAPVNGATEYNWQIPGFGTIVSGQNTNEICVTWNGTGSGVVRVTVANPCFPGGFSLFPVVVIELPPTIFPPMFVCIEDFPFLFDGRTFNSPGNYSYTETSAAGCDSIIRYTFLTFPQIPSIIDTTICAGTCVTIHNRTFCSQSTGQIRLPDATRNGCDSIIQVIVRTIGPTAVIANPAQLNCAPGSTVVLDGSSSSSGNNVTYQWSSPTGGTMVPPTNQNTVTVSSQGTYVLTVSQTSNGQTCTASDTVLVTQQTVTINTPTFTSAQTSLCAGQIGTYTINAPSGATSYTWSVTPPGPVITGSGTSVTINWGNSSGGRVCVVANGQCGNSPPACVDVTVNPNPTSTFSIPSSICQTEEATIVYTGNADPASTFTWTLNGGTPSPISGPGPHQIRWATGGSKTVTLVVEDPNGCISSQTSQMVQVDLPLAPPTISCNSTTTSITFSWNAVPNATSYDISINNNPVGNQTTTSYTVDNLNPNDQVTITVTVNGTTSCGPSMASETCVAQNCPPVTLNIQPVNDICRDASPGAITLIANPTGGAGGGTLTWSGPGTSSNGTFDPTAANIGSNTITLTYMEGTCTYTESITINVYEAPSPDFTVVSPICNDATTTVEYTGSGSSNATYTWDFNGGTVVSGSGSGPYQIQWATGGSYTVSLVVSENGCSSQPFTQTVQVDEPLAPPVITCTRTTTSITFSWDPVSGATSYTVNLLSGTAGTHDPNTNTYTVTGLNTGDMVEIEVVANGTTACGPSQATITCEPDPCPADQVIIDPVGPFCQATATAVQLVASMSSGNTAGTFTFSGPGTTSTGIFDASLPSVNPGTLTVRATYTIDNCVYNGTLDIVINEPPTADFTVDNLICVDGTSTIEYNGTASPGATYTWDFAGGMPANATGPGPHEIKWDTDGVKTVILNVDENNCPSEPEQRIVQVDPVLDPPVINCDQTQTSVGFSWDPVLNATDYTVTLIQGQAGAYDDFNREYNVTGINPGDQVTISVTANTNSVCGPVTTTQTCTALDCPDNISVSIRQQERICLEASVTNINLHDSLDIVGGSNDFFFTWYGGSYITPEGRFFPHQAFQSNGNMGGTFTVYIDYEDPAGTGCIITASMDIDVVPLPGVGISAPPRVCVTDAATVQVLGGSPNWNYDWDFGNTISATGSGAGPYDLRWATGGITDTIRVLVDERGCFAPLTIIPIIVDEPLQAPPINCMTGNTFINFSWPLVTGATDYQIAVLSGPASSPTTQTNTSADFANLSPQDEITIQLTVSDVMSACPPVVTTQTCIAKECPPTVLGIDKILDTCLVAGVPKSFNLVPRFTDDPGNGSGAITWQINGNPSNGVFAPNAPGNYNIRLSYSYDGCNYETTRLVTMYQTPVASLTADDRICMSDANTVRFTGTAPSNATYTWNLNGGTPSSVTGPGPHQINWSSTGTKVITVVATANGCVSTPATFNVLVDQPLTAPVINCNTAVTTTTSTGFTWAPILGAAEYEVIINGVSRGRQVGTSFTENNLTPDQTIDIRVRALPPAGSECPPTESVFTCKSNPCPPITLAIDPVSDICLNLASNVTLIRTVNNSDGTGVGTWSGSGVSANGVFNPLTAGAGTHTITYAFNEQACSYETSITVDVHNPPVADAGTDQEITCVETVAQIGGDGTSQDCPCLQYTWTLNGEVVSNELFPNVTEQGTYTLTVFNAETGCEDTDVTVVDASVAEPELNAAVNEISCFGRNDGSITVNGVNGGEGPFLYSLNGSNFSQQSYFSNLSEGSYTLRVQDSNGCEDEVTFEIIEPDEMTVELRVHLDNYPNATLNLGDSVQLEAITNYAPQLLQSVDWSPLTQVPNCDETNIVNCLTVYVSPTGQTIYTVRIENLNGCAADDNAQINVKKVRPVYIPSGFSPSNGDNINDLFRIYGDTKVVTNIRAFKIFDRWGETVYEAYDFQPCTDDASCTHGWDGTMRGQKFNPGVFVYYAEIEFFDGLVEIFKGDVTLK